MTNLNCTQDCLNCTNRVSFFNELNEDELALIDKSKNIVTFKSGEIILKQGAPLSHIANLTDGLVKVYLEGENKNLILTFLRPTVMIAGPGLFTDFKIHFTVKAVEETCICFVDAKVIQQILANNHKLSIYLLVHSHEQTIHNFNHMVTLTQRQMHGRIAKILLFLSKEIYKDNKDGFFISRQDLADFSGMATESAIRIIKEFADEKLISLNGKKIKINQVESLERIYKNG